MSERTVQGTKVERTVAADKLNEIASSLRSGAPIEIRVGNKTVDLAPPEKVNYNIEVVEKQRRFRGNRERITIELDWKPE